MEISLTWFYVAVALFGLAFFALIMVFLISRKSQKVMGSLLAIMTRPERAKIADATRVLNTILADEINKIELSFQIMRDTLNKQINDAIDLKKALGEQNEQLVSLADDATKKLSVMSGRLDNTVMGLRQIVESQSWQDVEGATDRFNLAVNDLLAKIDSTSQDTVDRTTQINTQINAWIEKEKELSGLLQEEFAKNDGQLKNITSETETTRTKLTELAESVAGGFDNVKTAAANYEELMIRNDRLLDGYLEKLDLFAKQSKNN